MTENHHIRSETHALSIESGMKSNRASNQQNDIAQQNSQENLKFPNSNMSPF